MAARPTYWLTRFMILRMLGFVYVIAFAVAIDQILPLIGSHGLLPIGQFKQAVTVYYGSTASAFWHSPSLFWIGHSDGALLTLAWCGFIVACMMLAGYANAITMTILWLLYMSFVNLGQDWYGFGWEIQLLETGFLGIFLCPLIEMRPFPREPTPLPVIWLFRWLIFRIMLGSGLIKWRGDKVWKDATALYYHFETQPIPGPLSRWFHFLPHSILRLGVSLNWVSELLAPWFSFWPRWGRHAAGIAMILLQVILIFSGNLSFLNWLTIVPALACFDDGFWSRILPRPLVRNAFAARDRAIASSSTPIPAQDADYPFAPDPAAGRPSRPMRITAWIVFSLISLLSLQPIANLLSNNQVMNTSFDPFSLVNTYGAFGSVGQERLNLVIEGTNDPGKDGLYAPPETADWKPYHYRGLPVELDERPPQIAPYQPHLDWQLWFAAMGTPDEYPWTKTLVKKLLQNDAGTLSLFRDNPFPDRPPRYIRICLYKYRFAKPGNKEGHYWERERIGDYWLPPSRLTEAPKN